MFRRALPSRLDGTQSRVGQASFGLEGRTARRVGQLKVQSLVVDIVEQELLTIVSF